MKKKVTKVTYKEWVELKQELKSVKGNVTEVLETVSRSRRTMQKVKASKSFKNYQELANK